MKIHEKKEKIERENRKHVIQMCTSHWINIKSMFYGKIPATILHSDTTISHRCIYKYIPFYIYVCMHACMYVYVLCVCDENWRQHIGHSLPRHTKLMLK